ncbi:MAG: hemerythrin domain-containing protein [Deltaproteobacteria bacterium]|nr:hemerythrin domain-containing protein [Deltaproteobacteria bacterium]
MNPIEVLVEEHRLITRASECLARMIGAAMLARRLKFLQAESIVDFIGAYADAWHHAKEEHELFPRVAARKPSWDVDHLADLGADHERCRACAREMHESFREGAHGDPEETQRFCRNAQEWIDLIRMHIYKEDRVAFPLMEHALTADDTLALLQSYAALEADPRFAGIDAKYRTAIEELEFVYNIVPPSNSPDHGG